MAAFTRCARLSSLPPRIMEAFTEGVAASGLAPGSKPFHYQPTYSRNSMDTNGMGPDRSSNPDPMDTYSQTVMRVAEIVTPHVAAIEVRNGRGSRALVGSGSAVVFTR